jgi:serine protease Do
MKGYSAMKKLSTLTIFTMIFLVGAYFVIGPKAYTSPVVLNAEEAYEQANNSIFYVRNLQKNRVSAVGTGFLIQSDGQAVTAYHVIKGAEQIEATLQDGTVVKNIKLRSYDEQKDIAILDLPNKKGNNLKGLEISNSPVKHGTEIFAIGFPLKETSIITQGIVNAPSAPINGKKRILVSAEIVSGMSGGPVLDETGKVIGIISGSLRTMNNIHLVVESKEIESLLR